MDHLQLTADTIDTADLLADLLGRIAPPTPPALPPDSRTALALAHAAAGWSQGHRRTESAFRDHVDDVRRVLHHLTELDRGVFR